MQRGQYVLKSTAALYNRILNGYIQRHLSSITEVTKNLKPEIGTAKVLKIARQKEIPVESYSLSRGLALNRFEKDFLVFPEYSESDDLANIKSFVSIFQKDFESSYGLEMCNKDLLAIYEVLGLNWNVYEVVDQINIATKLILLFGSDEQKDRFLPKLASGELRPAICISEENLVFDYLNMKTTSASGDGRVFKINGVKTEVLGASNANLFFVFANQISSMPTNEASKQLVCYLVELNEENNDSIVISPRTKTLGLQATEVSKVELRNCSVNESNRLGSIDNGTDVIGEVLNARSITFAATVVGFMKSLIGKLAKYCNGVVQHNVTLADNKNIQNIITDIALHTFILESMAYYIGGMLDENLIVAVDIENAVINNFASHLLREAVTVTTEILGFGSCDCDFEYEKIIRDVMTIVSLGSKGINLTDLISMNTITSWANVNAFNLEKLRSGAAGFFGLFKGKGAEWRYDENPKLRHFIAEHAHPSLQEACQNLEYNMSHLNSLIGAVLRRHGKNIVNDLATLSSIAKVVEYNLGMVATIARSSRSYCIGLRNADIEAVIRLNRQWVTGVLYYLEFFGLVQMNPSLLAIGRFILDSKGYCLESPSEMNW
uniref:Acyl-CoA dehydrogenase family member 9, mitochondrial n=1 Tax=Syphacia muris TaxID=451379 RepID=A0A158R3U6_9BILA